VTTGPAIPSGPSAAARGGAIERYLAELGLELRVPGRLRRRVLAEAREHLADASQALRDAGYAPADAEAAAVAGFGGAGDLGRGFLELQATATARRAAAAAVMAVAAGLLGLVAAEALLLSAELGRPSLAALPQLIDQRAGAGLLIAMQVAAVAGGLGLVRWLRWAAHAAIPVAGLRPLLRASTVAAVAVAAGSACGLAALASWPAAVRASDLGAAMTAAAGPSAVLAVAAAAAVGNAWLWASRLGRLGLAPGGAPDTDVVGDLAALSDVAVAWSSKRSPAVARSLRLLLAGGRMARARIARRWPALATCGDLRRHPWRVCATVTAAATLASLNQWAIAGSATSPAVWAALEAAAVVTGFALLGGFLGLRPPVRRSPRAR
jgi:hypothetical protein